MHCIPPLWLCSCETDSRSMVGVKQSHRFALMKTTQKTFLRICVDLKFEGRWVFCFCVKDASALLQYPDHFG